VFLVREKNKYGKDVIERFKMNNRTEVVLFLKNMWNDNPMPCTFCGGKVDYLQ
jgi:hypothetical protein